MEIKLTEKHLLKNCSISVNTQKFFRKQKKDFKKPSGLTDEDIRGALIRNKKHDFGGDQIELAFDFALAFNSESRKPGSGCEKQSSPHLSFNKPRKGVANKSRNALSLESTAQELTVIFLCNNYGVFLETSQPWPLYVKAINVGRDTFGNQL